MVSGGSIDTVAGPRPQLSYLGWPIVPCPKMPCAGSQTGKVMILFGDLHLAATLGDRRGVTVRQSRHRYLEQRKTAEKALVTVIQEAWIGGVFWYRRR